MKKIRVVQFVAEFSTMWFATSTTGYGCCLFLCSCYIFNGMQYIHLQDLFFNSWSLFNVYDNQIGFFKSFKHKLVPFILPSTVEANPFFCYYALDFLNWATFWPWLPGTGNLCPHDSQYFLITFFGSLILIFSVLPEIPRLITVAVFFRVVSLILSIP